MTRNGVVRNVLVVFGLCAFVGGIPARAIVYIPPVVEAPLKPHSSPSPVAAQAPSATRINLEGTWKFKEDLTVDGYDRGWASPTFDDSKWSNIKVPGDWESQGFTNVNPAWAQSDDLHQPYTGYAWYRKSVVIPAEWKGKTIMAHLGKIDDLDWTRINGRWIGETSDRVNGSSAEERVYRIPEELIRWGKPNVIAIRVLDYRGLGGMREGPVFISCEEDSSGPAVTTPGNDAVKIGGGVIVQTGQTVKDAVAVGGTVDVYGHVQGDAVSVGGSVHVHSGGVVDGEAVAIGGQVVTDGGGVINGSKTTIGGLPLGMTFPWSKGSPWDSLLFGMVIGFGKNLLATLLALLTVALFLSRTETVARTITEKPGYSILYGFLAMLLVIPVALFLLVTCIGIPLILVEGAILLMAKFLGFAGLSLAVGWKLGEAFQKPIDSPAIAVLIGGLALSLIGLVPFLGGAIDWALRMFGFGAVFITGFGASVDWIWTRKQNGAPPPGLQGAQAVPPAQE